MPELNWSSRYFDELTPRQLYEILRLRSEIFVLEQECLYQDLDNYDQDARHLLGSQDDVLVCYARLLPPTVKYSEPSIGRVICALSARSKGYGKQLMQKSIEYSDRYWPGLGIRISAQQRLERFYREFEFETSSDPYLEDGIPHVEMLRKPVSPF